MNLRIILFTNFSCFTKKNATDSAEDDVRTDITKGKYLECSCVSSYDSSNLYSFSRQRNWNFEKIVEAERSAVGDKEREPKNTQIIRSF